MSHGGPLRVKSLNILSWCAGLKQRGSREAMSVMLWEKPRKKQAAQRRLPEDTDSEENKQGKDHHSQVVLSG